LRTRGQQDGNAAALHAISNANAKPREIDRDSDNEQGERPIIQILHGV
jgi:hypothetical protein